jgi:hypothetical protein
MKEFEKDICVGACPSVDDSTNMSTAAIRFASTLITFAKLNKSDALNFLS